MSRIFSPDEIPLSLWDKSKDALTLQHSITDIPSGTGAASLSLLCNIAQLREEKVMPTLKMNIEILAGEISVYAIDIFKESFNSIKDYLEENEIYENQYLNTYFADSGMPKGSLEEIDKEILEKYYSNIINCKS
jgi:methylase of polypeptide subunit release factors